MADGYGRIPVFMKPLEPEAVFRYLGMHLPRSRQGRMSRVGARYDRTATSSVQLCNPYARVTEGLSRREHWSVGY